MFELLADVKSVPIDPDSLTRVHRGMNKVRVSVVEYTSEPSEVYIVTGAPGQNMETYVIFCLLEPGIQVVYGFDQNPYEPSLMPQVLEEATIFVEEMGSILEEVPWETMSGEQRAAWVEKEILYKSLMLEDLVEIEAADVLEIVDEAEGDEGEEKEPEGAEPDEQFLVIGDEEVSKILGDEPTPARKPAGPAGRPAQPEAQDGDEEEKEGGEGEQERASARIFDEPENITGDIVVADGDFDELLKQAFLKPELAEKASRKARLEKLEKVEEPSGAGLGEDLERDVEDLGIETADGVEWDGLSEGDDHLEGRDEGTTVPEEPGYEVGIQREAQAPAPVKGERETPEAAPKAGDSGAAPEGPGIRIIRFLSRF